MFLENNCLNVHHEDLGKYFLFADGLPEWLFCENETNNKRLYGSDANASATYRLRLMHQDIFSSKKITSQKTDLSQLFFDFDAIFKQKKQEADNFYNEI